MCASAKLSSSRGAEPSPFLDLIYLQQGDLCLQGGHRFIWVQQRNFRLNNTDTRDFKGNSTPLSYVKTYFLMFVLNNLSKRLPCRTLDAPILTSRLQTIFSSFASVIGGTSGLKQRGQRGPTRLIRASFWETQPRPVHDRKQEACSLWVSGTRAPIQHSDAAQMHSQGVCVCVQIAFKEEIRTEVKKQAWWEMRHNVQKVSSSFFFFFFKIVTCTNASIRKNV